MSIIPYISCVGWLWRLALVLVGLLLSVPVLTATEITVITHGFCLDSKYPEWVDRMAEAVISAARKQSETTKWYYIEISRNAGKDVSVILPKDGSIDANAKPDQIIVTVDWSTVSNHELYGLYVNTTSVARQIADILRNTDAILGTEHPLVAWPVHLIGHSRGGSVMLELAHILGENGIWVDHLTTLDPHPVRKPDIGTGISDVDPLIWLADNVVFADNYWRRDAEIPAINKQIAVYDFDGNDISTAYSRLLDEGVLNGLGDIKEHSDVHTWYHGTIDTEAGYPNSDGDVAITSAWYADPMPSRFTEGFAQARLIYGGYALRQKRPYGIGINFGGQKQRTTPIVVGQQWANIGDICLPAYPENILTQGNDLVVKYRYQDRDSEVHIEWFLGSGINPVTDIVEAELSQDLPSTGSEVVEGAVTLSTAGLETGRNYYVLAKITSVLDGRVRWDHSFETFTVKPPVFGLDSVTPENVVGGIGSTRLVLRGNSFGVGDEVLVSDGTVVQRITPTSISRNEILADFDFGSAAKTWEVFVRQYIGEFPLQDSVKLPVVVTLAPDTSSFTVSWVTPAAGSTLSQVVTAKVDAGIADRVEYWLDGTLAFTSNSAPFTWMWDTRLIANGLHSLVAKSYAGDTLLGTTASISVSIANVVATPDTDENNSSLTATPLPLGTIVQGLISSRTDVDWFQIEVSTPGILNFSLSVPDGQDYDLELYGPDAAYINGSYGDTGAAENIGYSATVAGIYYVRIHGYPVGNSSFSTTLAYALSSRLAPLPGLRFFSLPPASGSSAAFALNALGVSCDGTVVVGFGFDSVNGTYAFRWPFGGIMEKIAIVPGFNGSVPAATAVSSDGAVTAGVTRNAEGTSRAFVFPVGGSLQELSVLPFHTASAVAGISGDGQIVAGSSSAFSGPAFTSRGFRWSAHEGMQDLGLPPEVVSGDSFARAISADGSVVVGYYRSASQTSLGNQAFRWSSATGMESLGTIPNKAYSYATGVSADGSVIVGGSDDGSSAGGQVSERAFVWRRVGGMTPLGLPVAFRSSRAAAITPDASAIAGTAKRLSTATATPVIWDATGQMIEVSALLVSRGIDLAGWQLSSLTAIAGDDGVYAAVGAGTFNGQDRAFLITGLEFSPEEIPTIGTQPTNQAVSIDGSVTFSVDATGSGPLAFQWKRNGVDLANDGRVTGATTATLSIASVLTADAGTYTVVVSNGMGQEAVSDAATLTVSTVPVITVQPIDVLAVENGSVVFLLEATGEAPFTYRWFFTPQGSSTPQALNDLEGKYIGTDTATLTIHQADSADEGDYVAEVTDSDGAKTLSEVVELILADRALQIPNLTAGAGDSVVVPVKLVADGNENVLGFSLQFDPLQLAFQGATLGARAAGTTLNVNTSQAASGRVGVALARSAASVWAAGVQEIVLVTFVIDDGLAGGTVAGLSFGDTPVVREMSDVEANELLAAYQGGGVLVLSGYEADMNDNGAVTITDWVRIGRIVAGLDPAPVGVDFTKTDCAPRSAGGNGSLSITDWVQAGRYAAGLDPLTPAGGPTGSTP